MRERARQEIMKLVLVLYVTLVTLISQVAANDCNVQCEFQRIATTAYRFGSHATIPTSLSRSVGWGTGLPTPCIRWSLPERRDCATLKSYAAEVSVNLGPDRIFLSQLIPGDANLLWMFSKDGRILHVFEMFPDRGYVVEEITNGAYDELGYRGLETLR